MHRLTQANRAGLTLIEMVVALVAACIVLLATAIIVVFGQKSWGRTLQQANLQRDASYAMLKMEELIRNASTKPQYDAGGQGVKIDPDANWIHFWFVPARKDLEYQLKGEPNQTLLGGIVKNATFGEDPCLVALRLVDPNVDPNKAVVINLWLQNGDCIADLNSTTMMRNYSAGP
jgi:Tfp pilus assembly protein PilW